MFTVLKGHNGLHPIKENNIVVDNILRVSEDFILTKRFSTEGKFNANMLSRFDIVSEHYPTTLGEMLTLAKELEDKKHWQCIRGQYLKQFKNHAFVLRNAQTVEFVASNIVCVDIDGIRLPEGMNPLDLEAQGLHVVSLLHDLDPDLYPEDLGFIVHASSSAGMGTGMIKVHMYFESLEAVTQPQLKFAFTRLNKDAQMELIDTSLYDAAHIHYFAAPIFRGIVDPFHSTERLFMLEGDKIQFKESMEAYKSRNRNLEVTDNELNFFGLVNSSLPPESSLKVMSAIRRHETLYSGDNKFIKLASVYHTAWQEGVSIDSIDRWAIKHLTEYIAHNDKSRPVEEYIANAKRHCIKVFLEESKRILPNTLDNNLELKTIVTDENNKYVRIKELPPENSITFLKASLGTGKTTTIQQWLNRGLIQGKFLTITNTSALVESNARRFDAGDYRDEAQRQMFMDGTISRLSGTIHSLSKIDDFCTDFDFVFIDECDAVMNDVLFNQTIDAERKLKIINTLFHILMSAKRVVLSDGDIGEETVHAYGSLIDYGRPMYRINHERKILQGATAIQYNSPKYIWGSLLDCLLEMNEKCILVSDCGPDELNEKGIILRALTGKNIKEIHSASKADEDISRIINFTTDELKRQNIDCLLCSPSVTNGVDFNYFDTIFVITNTNNHSPNLRFQALRRDRVANFIFFYTSPMTKGFDAGSSTFLLEKSWEERARAKYASRREEESRNYENTFRYYLLKEGCKIQVHGTGTTELPKMEDLYMDQKIDAILNAEEFKLTPRHNNAYEIKCATRNYLGRDSDYVLCRDDVTWFLEERPDKKAQLLYAVFDEFWEDISKCTFTFAPFQDALASRAGLFYTLTGKSAKKFFAKKYMKQMGIEELGSFDQALKYLHIYCDKYDMKMPLKLASQEGFELV